MVPGKRIVFADGVARILPPLTFRQMREADEEGLTAKLVRPEHAQEAALAGFILVHRALARNYPELPLADMEALLDPGLVSHILPLLLGKLPVEERQADPGPKV
jgi:hypothetical protein